MRNMLSKTIVEIMVQFLSCIKDLKKNESQIKMNAAVANSSRMVSLMKSNIVVGLMRRAKLLLQVHLSKTDNRPETICSQCSSFAMH
jgi:hypothetical protein